jgi:4-hydroxymandelate oxidase
LREISTYSYAVSGALLNVFDYEARARDVLPDPVWQWIAGGQRDEVTVRRNRSAFEALTLQARFLRDVRERDQSTTVLGTEISTPIIIGPAGAHGLAHSDGELATARGAGMSNTLMVAGTWSDYSLEEIADAASGPLWFQLYHLGHEITRDLVCRAEAAGYGAICLTVDSITGAAKERDFRTGFSARVDAAGFGIGNLRGMGARIPEVGDPDDPRWRKPARAPVLTWDDLAWLRGLTSLPLVLKGLMTAEDARLAVEHGVEGVFVSNHGGRSIDMLPSSIEVLPGIVEAVAGRAEVYLDSGIRRGTDVMMALALGARAVAIARPYYWGLAVAGAAGVHDVLEILRAELDTTMASCGQTSVQALEPGIVNVPAGWGPGSAHAFPRSVIA